MGKGKKRKQQKPWCFYCDREFQSEKILLDHQKARHWKCDHCRKQLDSTQGLVTHVLQVHKENLTKVPNAKEGRNSVEFKVWGMEGIPDEFMTDDDRASKRRREVDALPKSADAPAIPIPTVPPMVGGPPMMPGYWGPMVPPMGAPYPPYGPPPGFRGPPPPGGPMPYPPPGGPGAPPFMGRGPPPGVAPMPLGPRGGGPPGTVAPPGPPGPPGPGAGPGPAGPPPATTSTPASPPSTRERDEE
eukprot:TRINITY_DN60258_c0_g1_i1.p2 TRINITY_DN60258_c0_g1~~TRINITY_DN60258_c0_g1_i1.p2  ORF type:complete len:244 (+),score=32.02 TRINITY_DN60258_c0_g1_i1:47-778(+)